MMILEKTLSFIRPLFSLGIILLIYSISLNAQEKYEYQHRTDLTFDERVRLAESYFDRIGRDKGKGYTQFLRWKYWAEQSLDENGMVIEDRDAQQALAKFYDLYGNQSSNFIGTVFEEMGPKSATNTSTWSSALGRISTISIANDNTFNHIIVGAPTGGVWKTTDGGNNWTPIFDKQNTLNVWSILISPFNSNHYFVGTSGQGIYKSTNAGGTWAKTNGLPEWDLFNTIVMDPTNANILYAVGQYSSRIYKSTDGGNNWVEIYDFGSISGYQVYDFEFKPDDPNTFYIAGTGGVSKTTNGGNTFTKITNPFLFSGAIMLGVSPANPNYVYAVQENQGSFYGVFRSTNAGDSYTNIANNNGGNNNLLGYSLDRIGGQAPRDMDIIVSHTDINEVQVAGIESHRSFNGGSTWTQNTAWYIPSSLTFHHADVDALYYVARNGVNRIYAATDGGIYYSDNKGMTFNDITPGIGVRQFYKIGLSKTVKDWVCGGSQDNGTGVHRNDGKWYDWLGADGMECLVDHSNAQIMYGTIQYGTPFKSTNGGQTYFETAKPAGSGSWVTPIEQDPNNSNTLYIGYDRLYKTTNGGQSWSQIANFSGGNANNKLRNVKIAPNDPNTMYIAYSNKIYRTTNGGTHWTDITPSFNFYTISSIAVHPTNSSRLILTLSGTSTHRVIESNNGGTDWTNITTNLPGLSYYCAAFQANNQDGIFLGASRGVFYKDNTKNGNWEEISASSNLPNVQVREIELGHDYAYFATYGRGLWKLSLSNDLPNDLTLNSGTIGSGTYRAMNTLSASVPIIANNTVTFQSGQSVNLGAGFQVPANTEFTAEIVNFTSIATAAIQPTQKIIKKQPKHHFNDRFTIYPNPTGQVINLAFQLNESQQITAYLMDFSGKIIQKTATQTLPKGEHIQQINPNGNLSPGLYQVVLQTEGRVYSRKIMYKPE
jgi:photosystem II stability/assembly factor-like uncharacterized protein